LELGVERINRHANAMIERLKDKLPRLGYRVVTPRETRAPLVTCVLEDARRLAPRLQEAKIRMTVSRNRFRVTPSVFNDMADIDALLRVLGPNAPGNKPG
jgi:selenocysteine lyase/cysteine desulfurase